MTSEVVMPTNNKISVLEKRIKERLELTIKICKFAESLLYEKGVLIKESMHSSHCNIIREMKDFMNFSFFGDFGQSMMGGNDVKIWYPEQKDEYLVFHVRFQGATIDDECKLKIFIETGDWLQKLKIIIRNKNKFLAAFDKKSKTAKAKSVKQIAEDIKMATLRAQAERLCLK